MAETRHGLTLPRIAYPVKKAAVRALLLYRAWKATYKCLFAKHCAVLPNEAEPNSVCRRSYHFVGKCLLLVWLNDHPQRNSRSWMKALEHGDRQAFLLACLLGNEPILYSCSSWPRWERTRSWDWINLQAYVDNWILQPGTVAATCQLYRAFFRSEREGSHVTWTVISHTTASPQVRKNVHCRQNHLLSLLLYKHVTN